MIDLLAIFGDAKFHEFGIRSQKFNMDESNPILTVEIGHYRQSEVVEVTFRGVYYHCIMSESFIFMNDEDSWEMNITLARAKTSELIPWIAKYTLLGAEHIVGVGELIHYRVFAQDHFIDVVCNEKPKILLRAET